jgi:chromosome segregation ATPase
VGDTTQLVKRRRADSAEKTTRVLAVLKATAEIGRPLSVAALARQAQVSRRFIYDHPELRAEVARCAFEVAERSAGRLTRSARVSAASLRADLENAKARNRRLEAELASLKRRLGEVIGAEIADADDPGGPRNVQLRTQVEELDQALFEAREELARHTEELEAARQINRELMARLNRGG